MSLNFRSGQISSSGSSKIKFLSIEQWTDAFNIFASVRRVRFPSEADGLAAYINLIQRIAHEKGSWFFYDSTFRKLKQTSDKAWQEIDNELFILALSHKQQPFCPGWESEATSKSASRSGHKSCNKYNRGLSCNGYYFPHICRECGKPNHPRYRCWSKLQKTSNVPAEGKLRSGLYYHITD